MKEGYEANINNQNNFNNFNPNSSSKIDVNEGKGKRKKGLKKLEQKTAQDENFNIYGLGEIKYAKLHRNANRPLRQVVEELDQDAQKEIQKCPCCNLPAPDEEQKYFKYFSTNDSPDDFSNCGQGVVLYYSFIKFVIINLLIVAVGISCFTIYYSFTYYKELEKVCDDLYQYPSLKEKYESLCKLYISDAEVDSTFFQFSAVNVKDYIKLRNKIYGDGESSVVNFSRINFCCIIFVFIFNLVFIYFLYNKSNAADYLVFTVSDYSIFLYNLYDVHDKFLEMYKGIEEKKKNNENVPPEEYENIGGVPKEGSSELEIFKNFLINKICQGKYGEKFSINRIDFCFKLEKLSELQLKYELCLEQMAEIENSPKLIKENQKANLDGDNRKHIASKYLCCKQEKIYGDIKKEKEELEKQIKEIIEDSKKNTSNYFGGAALVTFDTIKEQELYLKNLPKNSIEWFFHTLRNGAYLFCSCCFNNNDINYLKRKIKFEAAPEPEDIMFENVEISHFSRVMRTTLVYIISIIICAVSFALIIILNYIQVSKLDAGNSDLILYLLSLAITAVTSGIDVFLEKILKVLTNIEKQSSKTNDYLSYSVKLTLFTFLNSALLPLFSEKILDESDDGYKILISNMLVKFLVNAFITPIMWTVNVSFFVKKIQIWYIENKIESEKDKEEKTYDKNQKELNELYEYPLMNVELKYSYIFKTLLMSFLYIPIFPLGIIISLIGFVLGYWLEKFNFANMYKRPEMLNRQIAEFYVQYFIVVLFVFGIGDYVFLSDAYDSRVWSLLNIIIFGVLIIMPYHQILNRDAFDIDES